MRYIKIIIFIFACLFSLSIYAQISMRKVRTAYYSVDTNKYSVGTYNTTNNVFTFWSNIFVKAKQLPQTGPYSRIEYIFEQGERPKYTTHITNSNGSVFLPLPPKLGHTYGKTNLVKKVTDRPMICAIGSQNELLFGFDTGEGLFLVASKTNAPIKVIPPIKKYRREIRYIEFPIHRTNDLEALKQKYIKDYGNKNK
jgi:hypothetical protein